MRRGFDAVDFARLADLWASFYPTRYHVSPELLRANTVDSELFDWGASVVEYDGDRPIGFVAVKKSANPHFFIGPDPDQAHITALAFADPVVGVEMMSDTKRTLRNRGLFRLVFGQDSGHFFPGCPVDHASLRSFLTVEGFEEKGTAVDLERDMTDYEPPAGMIERLAPARVEPCRAETLPALSEFLKRTFPGRWTFDVLHKVVAEPDPACVMLLMNGDHCEGMALLQWEGCARPIGGAVWHRDLGPSWGSLGPIGVSADQRGKGWGHGLLAASLQELRNRGARRTIIDWTTLVDFYGAHGFQVAREYVPMSLSL